MDNGQNQQQRSSQYFKLLDFIMSREMIHDFFLLRFLIAFPYKITGLPLSHRFNVVISERFAAEKQKNNRAMI